eukprot:TRINITY_DN91700_c0_g1_i1.p1 TRINITY_DN91700_c0_g1~~TRINITY_DN91700_c0_g1_i1.p1  ORF type:complete len:220 (-),score=43.39 TRINITY_DN91700_c0_g1_i1:126-785(-)
MDSELPGANGEGLEEACEIPAAASDGEGLEEARQLAALLARLQGCAAELESQTQALKAPGTGLPVAGAESPPFLVIVQTLTGEELLEPITSHIGVASLRERLFTEVCPKETPYRPKLYLDTRELLDGEILGSSDVGVADDHWPLIVTVVWQIDPLAERMDEFAQKHEELDLVGDFESIGDMHSRLTSAFAELGDQVAKIERLGEGSGRRTDREPEMREE